jgi:hypothetical protein
MSLKSNILAWFEILIVVLIEIGLVGCYTLLTGK